MAERIRLSDIQNPRVRNIVRGILGADRDGIREETLSSLRQESSPGDAYLAFKFLLESPLGRRFPHPEVFPERPARLRDLTFFPPASLPIELAIQRARMEDHANRLVHFILGINDLNRAVFADADAEIAKAVTELGSTFGHSAVLLRKLISLKHACGSMQLSQTAIQKYLAAYSRPKRDLLAVIFEDSIDLTRSYGDVRRTIVGYVREKRIGGAYGPIVADHFHPFGDEQFGASSILQAYGLLSIADVAFFLLSRDRELRMELGERLENNLDLCVPAVAKHAWKSLSSGFDEEWFERHDDDEPKFKELNFFRHTSAWLEFSAVTQYRRWIERSVGGRLDGSGGDRKSSVLTEDWHIAPYSVRGLGIADVGEPLNIRRIDPQRQGSFHRSLGLVHALETGRTAADLTGEELLQVLDCTVNVARLLSAEELSAFLPAAADDPLYEYLCAALLFDNQETLRSGHVLRKKVQNIVIKEFEGDVVAFANFLMRKGKHVGFHFFSTCNEPFLVQLYDMYQTPNEVTDARSRLLEWYGEFTDDRDLVDRARSLRLDMRLAAVRGDIDDNRIYADPIRFVLWLGENLADQIREAMGASAEWAQRSSTGATSLNPVAVLQDPGLMIASILESAFKEFCCNKFFGIDSYIGRRIRHGTLRGVMVTEVRALIDEAERNGLSHAALQYLREWLERYERAIALLGNDILHIQNEKKPRGAIVPSTTTVNKAAAAATAVDAIAAGMKTEPSLPAALNLIHDYCWLLLEPDLKRLKSDLAKMREELIIDARKLISLHDSQNPGVPQDVCRNLNEATRRKFEQLALWMTKPQNVSPSATLSLLFNAVLIEVSEQYPDFAPTVTESGNTAFDLYGHRYHYVYDILNILVQNAAKHGSADGPLIFDVTTHADARMLDVTIAVESQLKDADDEAAKRALIEEAMSGDIADALVTEGFSGLRKIRSIAAELDEVKGFEWSCEARRVRFMIRLGIPTV